MNNIYVPLQIYLLSQQNIEKFCRSLFYCFKGNPRFRLFSGLLAIPWVIRVVFREEKRWGSYAHTLEIEMSKSLTF